MDRRLFLKRGAVSGVTCGAALLSPVALLTSVNVHGSGNVSPGTDAGTVISLGSRRELFVDRYLIDRLQGATLTMQTPHDEGPVFRFSEPWEGPWAGYVTMIQDQNRLRMYYRGIAEKGRDGSEHERTCLAESADGIHWSRPDVGQYEFNGSKANNIVLANAAPVTHNFCPFIDNGPASTAETRYKAIGGTGRELFAYASADGLRWKRIDDEPFLSGRDMPFPFAHLFDSQNLAFWSSTEERYLCYFRVWDGIRRIARAESMDFRTWSNIRMMEQVHDDGSGPSPAPAENLYTNQTSPYFRAPHLYVAIAARFFGGRQVVNDEQAKAIQVDPGYFRDTSDAVLMTTRGGHLYDRTFLEGFLRPGIGLSNWVSRTNYPALNVVQTGPSEMSFYANQDYAQPTSHLRRYSLRIDGFASLHAGASEGEMLTRPFTFSGQSLDINFSTSAGGGVLFEIQNEQGQAIPGFSLNECQEQIGNEISRTVSWKSGSSVRDLAGQVVRLRVILKDADLFSLCFV